MFPETVEFTRVTAPWLEKMPPPSATAPVLFALTVESITVSVLLMAAIPPPPPRLTMPVEPEAWFPLTVELPNTTIELLPA